MDKRHRPIEILAFRELSAENALAGLPAESHVLAARGQLGELWIDHPLLGFWVGDMGEQVRDQRAVRQGTASAGGFCLLGPGLEQKPLAWSDRPEILYVEVGVERFERLLGHDLPCLYVNLQYAVADPHVASLVIKMRDELQAGCPNGKLYSETLSLALAAYLFKRYSVGWESRRSPTEWLRWWSDSGGLTCSLNPGPVGRDRLALSAMQVGRVCEYIRTNLARDIHLAELADQVSLSPHYFSMLFKRSFGVSPHYYVLSERIQEAQELLAARRLSIAEIAVSLGFSDQSHFSQVFRKMTGTTPKRYQSTCWNNFLNPGRSR